MDLRAGLEAAVRDSDGGQLPKGWPKLYEGPIDRICAHLEPGEKIRAAWRGIAAPRLEPSNVVAKHDVGLLVVTDRRVLSTRGYSRMNGPVAVGPRAKPIAPPHPDPDALLALPVDAVHTVDALDALKKQGIVCLLGADGGVLLCESEQLQFVVFAEGEDPSGLAHHTLSAEELGPVVDRLAMTLPNARAGGCRPLVSEDEVDRCEETGDLLVLRQALDQVAGSPKRPKIARRALRAYAMSHAAARSGGAGVIAFTSLRTFVPQVFAMVGDGGGQLALTQDKDMSHALPAWSPDGGKIVLLQQMRDGFRLIYVMNSDGSEVRQLKCARGGSSPTWSPDGTMIAFTKAGKASVSVNVARADGSDEEQLAQFAETPGTDLFDGGLSWSPDGTSIAFTSEVDGAPQVCVMKTDGSGQHPLTTGPSQNSLPSWSPDGTRIAYASIRDGERQIVVAKSDGTETVQLTSGAGGATYPSWSRDGSRIAFMSEKTGAPQVFTSKADGSEEQQLTHHPAGSGFPDWL